MSRLDAAKIFVRRGERAILEDVSLHAESGDFGAVMLDGISIRALSGTQLARRRAYLPQNPRCEWPISVERLVALGLTPTLPALGGLPASFGPKITQALQADR